MEKNIFIWIGAFVITYFILKAYFLLSKKGNIVDKELNEIINSDKYKIKGQYD